MDENKFDHFAKTLALASSRRQFVKLMAGSVVGGAISLLLPAVVFAKNPHACGDTGAPCKGSGTAVPAPAATAPAALKGNASRESDASLKPRCRAWRDFVWSYGGHAGVETSAPPYGGAQRLFTDLKPHDGPDYRNAHPSTVIDAYTRSARASRRSPVPGST